MNKLSNCFLAFFLMFNVLFTCCEASPVKNCTATLHKIAEKVELLNLNESSTCHWNLEPVDTKNETKNMSVCIFMETLLLDEGDELRVNSSYGIFGPYHGRDDAFVVITGSHFANVTLKTSGTKMKRHLSFSYQAQACAFPVSHIPVLTEQIVPQNYTEKVDCKYTYIVENHDQKYAYIFEELNVDENAVINIDGVKPPVDYKNNPPNFFSDGNVSIDITLTANTTNHIRLRKDNVNSACSGYLSVTGDTTITSPNTPKLNNGSILGECRWLLESGTGASLGLNFSSLNLNNPLDVIAVTDGKNFETVPFVQVTSSSQKDISGRVVRTSSKYMFVSFQSTAFASNFSAHIFVAGQSKYLFGNGSFNASGTPAEKQTAFLLEVPNNESLILNFKSSKLSLPAYLDVYEDFTTDSRKIATLYGDIWYPVISNSSKMMIIPNNFQSGQFEAEFKGISAGCLHMSIGDTDSYVLSRNCNTTCSWIIPPSDGRRNNEHLFLDLQHIALDKNDQLSIYRLDKQLVANITNEVNHFPMMLLNATEGAFINVTQGQCGEESKDTVLVGLLNYLPGYSKNFTIKLYEHLLLTSPNYPDTYPILTDCEWGVTSQNSLLHVTFKNLDLASQHYLNLSVGSGKQVESQTISGHTMPDDFFGSSNALLHFNSMNNNGTQFMGGFQSGQGFSVDVCATDCGEVMIKPGGSFANDPKKTLCMWKINVSNKTDERKSIFLLKEEKTKIGNYKLIVHDGASIRNNTGAFDKSDHFWSKSHTVIVIYQKEDPTKPSSVVNLSYSTRDCNKTDRVCDNGFCMHPDWICNQVDDCGDFTDEKNCGSVPIPPENQPRGSVSPVAYGISIVVFFLLGLGLAYLVPVLIRKCQNSQYRSFRDVSVIE